MTNNLNSIESITCSNCPNPFIDELVSLNDFKERCPRYNVGDRETPVRKNWEASTRKAGNCALQKLMVSPEPLT